MRILVPPTYLRSAIVEGLTVFFDAEHEPDFKRAIGKLCRFYKIPMPKVVWFERLGHSNSDTYHGFCKDNGTIQLIHPENWKRKRKYKTRRYWLEVVLHEMGHYALWANNGRVTAETKADRFRDAILKGRQ